MKRFIIWVVFLTTVLVVTVLFGTRAPDFMGNYAIRFNAYIFSLLIAMTGMVVLSVLLLRSRAKNAVAAWFGMMVLMSFCWTATYLMMAWASNGPTAEFWQHLLPASWILLPIIMFLFTISYIDEGGVMRSPLMWFGFPVAAVVLIYLTGYSRFIYSADPSTQAYYYWGYEYPFTTNAGVIFVYLWLFLVVILSLVLLVRAYRKTKNRLKRKQTGLFIFAFTQYALSSLIFDVIYVSLPENSVPFLLPPLTAVYTTVFALTIGYGIIRYGVFKVNPASLSGPILANLSEAVVAVNNDLEIEFTNKGTELITGYEQDILKGQHISMLFDATIFKAIVEGVRKADDSFAAEDTLIKDNHGTSIPVTLSVGGVYDDRKQQAGFIFVFANITELKKKTIELAREKAGVEQKVRERTAELSEERARLSASINSLKLGYIMTGQHGEIQVMNQAAHKLLERLAVTQDKDIPQNWRLTDVQDVFKAGTDIMDPIRRIQSQRQPLEIKEMQLAGRYVYVFIAPVTENNEVIGSVILFEDITDEKALNRSKEEFFIIASHELRTPLTKIRGSAELMNDVYKASITSDDALRMLAEIETSSTHLIEIVNMMIEISELEQGKVTLRPEPIDVVALTREVMQEVAKKIGKPGVKPQIACSMKELVVKADAASLKQILEGFVSNAFKFTEEGTVTVTIKPEEQHVRFRISDTGKGIEIENHGLLFRKFQQAGSSLLSRDAEGTGLGLYVVKLLTGIMGGKVGLEASEVGKGSTFFFTIPVNPPVQPEGAVAKKANL